MSASDSFIACLDVGTTTLRCIILNSSARIVGTARSTIKLIYPKPGFVEINPDELWTQTVDIIKSAISDAQLDATSIKCLGISTQRATFLTWYRDSGRPIHNLITWKDIRAKQLCKEINSSIYLKALRCGAYSIYLVTRSSRFLTGSRLKIASNHVTGRLLWAFENIPELKSALSENNVMFGTVDTWLLYKLTNRRLHVTDISNASATGFYDPFVFEWGSWAKLILGVPKEILPQVVDNDFDFGTTDTDVFGAPIPIKCVMADQSASMFASCCFSVDDIKVTLGTGAFLDVNTATKIHASVTGIYPLIGWKIKDKVMCMGEVACNDCGSLIEWLLSIGLIKKPTDIYDTVTSVSDSDGVYFIPAFSGFGPPVNDERASSGFLGIKPTTTQSHLVRSVIEGIVYRVALAYQTLKQERKRDYQKIIVDGGVSQNDFVCQMLADLTGLIVERINFTEMSALGVGFVAGLSADVWETNEELQRFNSVEKSFKPKTDTDYRKKYSIEFNNWLSAVQRFRLWYDEE